MNSLATATTQTMGVGNVLVRNRSKGTRLANPAESEKAGIIGTVSTWPGFWRGP